MLTYLLVMNILRMIKLFGWESKISERLSGKREDELHWIKKIRIWTVINNNLTSVFSLCSDLHADMLDPLFLYSFVIPLLTMVLTYATFAVIMGRPLSASIVFSSMAVFEQLREVVHVGFYFVPVLIQAKVSLERLTGFLNDVSPTVSAGLATKLI